MSSSQKVAPEIQNTSSRVDSSSSSSLRPFPLKAYPLILPGMRIGYFIDVVRYIFPWARLQLQQGKAPATIPVELCFP